MKLLTTQSELSIHVFHPIVASCSPHSMFLYYPKEHYHCFSISPPLSFAFFSSPLNRIYAMRVETLAALLMHYQSHRLRHSPRHSRNSLHISE